MAIDTIEFNGNDYPIAEVYSYKQKLSYTIATETLNKLLFDDEGEPVNEDAEQTDNQIGYYVPDEIINQNEEAIRQYIKKHIDKEF